MHSGKTVKHRSRVAKDPNQPNLRQVHLIHAELHDGYGRRLRRAGRQMARMSLREALICSHYQPAHGYAWAKRRWSK